MRWRQTRPPGSRTLRPGSSIAVGAVAAVAALSLVLPSLLTSPRSWPLISGATLALVLVWLFVVRPCAVIHDEGLRLVNPLRVVDITWPTITEVRSRWTLVVVAAGTAYTAWGVPADPGRPKYGRSLLTIPANRVARASGLTGTGATASDEPEPKRPKVEAQVVAAEVEARVAADRRRKDGRTPRIAHQAWDPVSVGLLAAGIAFAVIGIFVV